MGDVAACQVDIFLIANKCKVASDMSTAFHVTSSCMSNGYFSDSKQMDIFTDTVE